MSAWPQPVWSSDWSEETWVFKEGAKPWDLFTHALTSVEVHLQTNDTHTHAAWTQRRMARRERAKRYLAFKRGAADSQARSHLMPGHLPSVCWIIPLACSTTGTSLNTPVKYKKHTEQNALTHTHTQKERKKGCSYKQLAEICASQGGWQEEGSAWVRGGRGDPDSLESRFFRQWIRAKLTSATARVR